MRRSESAEVTRPRRAGLRAMRVRRRFRMTAVAAVLGIAISGAIAAPASAAGYPSWQDLQNAKANTASAQAKVNEIVALIANLQVQVAETQAAAEQRGIELQVAQDKYDDAVRRADTIQAQADASKAVADAATLQAGQLAAQLYRTGGTDLSANLVFDSGADAASTDELLSKLGSMSKLVERSTDIYRAAQTAANTAALLGAQAEVAQVEREALRVAAEQALEAAVAAQQAAEAALAESQAKSIELEAQLAFMKDAEAKTTAAYEEGERERKRLEAERLAREAAARAAAGQGSGARLPGGYISSQGWAVPASGRITDGYGPRAPINGSGSFHYGADIGTGCSAPIYAAHSGTVVYAGWNGTYGNWVQIDHGGGVRTGYAHIRNGGTWVGVGQWVDVGQNIASTGTTGASNGCHLHFEVFINGGRVNPFPFMADRGAPLG